MALKKKAVNGSLQIVGGAVVYSRPYFHGHIKRFLTQLLSMKDMHENNLE